MEKGRFIKNVLRAVAVAADLYSISISPFDQNTVLADNQALYQPFRY